MKHPARLPFVAGLCLALASIAHAHPGHDDGHELTWDFSHWLEHPLASAVCLAVVTVSTWAVWRLLRRVNAAADQSLRVSQARRGK